LPIERSSSFEDIPFELEKHDQILADSGISFYDFRDVLMQQRWDLSMLA
jgi:hypothetical protein